MKMFLRFAEPLPLLRKWWVWAALGLSLACAGPTPGQSEETAPTVVYLVRHAEAGFPPYDTPDPALESRGLERAEQLATVLVDAGITQIFSTHYRRTSDTAAPLARRLGIEVSQYDPDNLEQFASDLRSHAGEVILVAGHSNTTPELVQYLGGDPGDGIEHWQFDRLYVLLLQPEEDVITLKLRYGETSTPPEQ